MTPNYHRPTAKEVGPREVVWVWNSHRFTWKPMYGKDCRKEFDDYSDGYVIAWLPYNNIPQPLSNGAQS